MGYIAKDVITNELVQIIPDATLYHFGILESNVHMAVMQAYGFPVKSTFTESQCVAELFKLYKQMSNGR